MNRIGGVGGLADICDAVENLRENFDSDGVRRIAAHRARKWFAFADKLEEIGDDRAASVDAYRLRACRWHEVSVGAN